MNRLQLILLVLSTATFSPFVFSETTISPTKYEFYGQESKRHKSMLEVNNSSDHKINESQHNPFRSDSNKQNVDFLRLQTLPRRATTKHLFSLSRPYCKYE